MDRRATIRLAVLTAFGATFGRYDALAQTGIVPRGTIRAPLDQWKWLIFDYKGKRIALPTGDIFAALEEVYGSIPIKP